MSSNDSASKAIESAAVAAPSTSVAASFIRTSRTIFDVELTANKVPKPFCLEFHKLKGVGVAASGHLLARIVSCEVSFPRPPGSDLDVYISIIGVGDPGTSDASRVQFANDLAGFSDTKHAIIRCTNTSVDVFEFSLTIPPGVSDSVLGAIPPLFSPKLAVAFYSPTDAIAAAKVRAYITVKLEVSGHGYRA